MKSFATRLSDELGDPHARWTRDHLVALLCRVVDDVDLPEAPLEDSLAAIASRIGIDEHTTHIEADRRTRAFLVEHAPPPALLAEARLVFDERGSPRARKEAALAIVVAATAPSDVAVRRRRRTGGGSDGDSALPSSTSA